VEEVLVGDDGIGDSRQRLSISGWFHKPQEGEEGYESETTETTEMAKSSLQQLSTPLPITFKSYVTENSIPPETPLTAEEISFLSDYLNPFYLKAENPARFPERTIGG